LYRRGRFQADGSNLQFSNGELALCGVSGTSTNTDGLDISAMILVTLSTSVRSHGITVWRCFLHPHIPPYHPYSTLKTASITPSSLFFPVATITQNNRSLAFTLSTSSNTPFSNTLAKSTRMRSMGPLDSFRKHTKSLRESTFCQMMETGNSLCPSGCLEGRGWDATYPAMLDQLKEN
jgi:hypothetical protein